MFLAAFLANAANKFFVADLDHELQYGFYARIFDFQGDAPDQYRILPLLPLKLLCRFFPFNHSVLIYNLVFGFIVLELLWQMSSGFELRTRHGLSFGLSVLYIFMQYTGWRPDTMGLLCLSFAAAWSLRFLKASDGKLLLYGLSVLLLSGSRADIALVYALFATFYCGRLYAIWIPMPVIVQVLMQEVIFPSTQYYSKVFMLWDNLRLHYLLYNPATCLALAALVAFWNPIVHFVRRTSGRSLYFYILATGYFLLVLVIGRVNEYRLYLPLVPILLIIAHESRHAERK
ncbi:MAG: hypothetical protein RLZZ165_380 [Bacteroidota bacterium]